MTNPIVERAREVIRPFADRFDEVARVATRAASAFVEVDHLRAARKFLEETDDRT